MIAAWLGFRHSAINAGHRLAPPPPQRNPLREEARDMDDNLPEYELFAIRYAERDARRSDHFIGGDPHDGPMPMDYFVWAAIGSERSFVIDTGFTAEVAAARGRRHLRCPAESLSLVGLDRNSVADVILTHLHYDHVGTFHRFPKAAVSPAGDRAALHDGPSHAPPIPRPLVRGRGCRRHRAAQFRAPGQAVSRAGRAGAGDHHCTRSAATRRACNSSASIPAAAGSCLPRT